MNATLIRRRARAVYPTPELRRKWLRAVRYLLTESKTGWILYSEGQPKWRAPALELTRRTRT